MKVIKKSRYQLQGNPIIEERVIVKADCSLHFPGVEKFREVLNEAIGEEKGCHNSCILIDLSSVPQIDYTALKVSRVENQFVTSSCSLSSIQCDIQMLKSVAADYHKRGLMVLHFVNASPEVRKSIAAALPSTDISFISKVSHRLVSNC